MKIKLTESQFNRISSAIRSVQQNSRLEEKVVNTLLHVLKESTEIDTDSYSMIEKLDEEDRLAYELGITRRDMVQELKSEIHENYKEIEKGISDFYIDETEIPIEKAEKECLDIEEEVESINHTTGKVMAKLERARILIKEGPKSQSNVDTTVANYFNSL